MTIEVAKGIDTYIRRVSDGWLQIAYLEKWTQVEWLIIYCPKLGQLAESLAGRSAWTPKWSIGPVSHPMYPHGLHSPAPCGVQYPAMSYPRLSNSDIVPSPQCDDWRDAVRYALRPDTLPKAEPWRDLALQAIGQFDPLIIAVILAHIGRN